MISKSSSRSDDWDKWLPFLLFAYRASAQESTKESPLYLLFCRNPKLPTETTLTQPASLYTIDLEDYKILLQKSAGMGRAKVSIESAQATQKATRLYAKWDEKKEQETMSPIPRPLPHHVIQFINWL